MAAVSTSVNILADSTPANSQVSSAFTPAASDLLLVWVSASTCADAAPTLDSSVGGQTFSLIASAVKNASADSQYLFVCNQLATAVSQTVTFNSSGSAGEIFQLARVTGMSRAGTSAVRQTAKADNQAGSTTPAITFAASCLTGNPTIGLHYNSSTAPTTPTGWTAGVTTGQTGPTARYSLYYRDSGFTGATITWGGTTATLNCTLGVELDTSAEATSAALSAVAAASLGNSGAAQATAAYAKAAAAVLTGSGAAQAAAAYAEVAAASLTAAGAEVMPAALSASAAATLTTVGTAIQIEAGVFQAAAAASLAATGEATVQAGLNSSAAASLTTAGAATAQTSLNSMATASLTAASTAAATAEGALAVATIASMAAQGAAVAQADLEAAAAGSLALQGEVIAIVDAAFAFGAAAQAVFASPITAKRVDYGLPKYRRQERLIRDEEELLLILAAALPYLQGDCHVLH